MGVSSGSLPVPEVFLDVASKALRGMQLQASLCIVGVHLVKVSFLIFFYRLGSYIRNYLDLWCSATFVTLASLAVCMGLVDYKRLLGHAAVMIFQRAQKDSIDWEWLQIGIYCAIDVFSDLCSTSSTTTPSNTALAPLTGIPVLVLPISILWTVRLNLQKKLLLGFIFSLTLFTVSVTIVRAASRTSTMPCFFPQTLSDTPKQRNTACAPSKATKPQTTAGCGFGRKWSLRPISPSQPTANPNAHSPLIKPNAAYIVACLVSFQCPSSTTSALPSAAVSRPPLRPTHPEAPH